MPGLPPSGIGPHKTGWSCHCSPYSLSGTSFDVYTATTPGAASAFSVLIHRTRACGRSAKSIFMCNMPGIDRSPEYAVSPVTLPRASIRESDLPTVEVIVIVFGCLSGQSMAWAAGDTKQAYLLYLLTPPFIRMGGTSVGPYCGGPRNLYMNPYRIDRKPKATTAMAIAKTTLATRLVCR